MTTVNPQPGPAPGRSRARQGHYTLADWERLPNDGRRYELLNGVLYTMTTAPTNFHQWIVGRLIMLVGTLLHHQQAGVWFTAPIGLVVPPSFALQPDFLVVLNHNLGIVRGGRVRGAPDLVVEVLSPANTAREQHEKHAAYATIGVPEYAVVNPATRTLTRYRLVPEGGSYAEGDVYGEGDTVVFACLPDHPLAVADLFTGAPDTTLHVTDEDVQDVEEQS